jgi:hypothetical protein
MTSLGGMQPLLHPDPPSAFVINVAVTGHRAARLSPSLVRALRPLVYVVFRELRQTALSLEQQNFSGAGARRAQLRLHTPLATGADQIAAICARSSGYFVRALLPFEASEYRKDFAEGEELEMFEQALAAADEIVALPGQRSATEAAYLVVGQLLVETADLLIAIWDGEPGRGPGGTANVVELALENRTPVIHLHTDQGSDEVRMRVLLDGICSASYSQVEDPLVYAQVLRAALRTMPPQVSEQPAAA